MNNDHIIILKQIIKAILMKIFQTVLSFSLVHTDCQADMIKV